MAIFIAGKTVCQICSQAIDSSARMAALPRRMTLPPDLAELAGGCLHRACLDAFPRRVELLKGWQQDWRAEASAPGPISKSNALGIAMFRTTRFMFASLDTFIDFEEAADAFEPLRAFFMTFDGTRTASMTTAWNVWKLEPRADGVRMTTTRTPPPPGTLRASNDPLHLDYTFTPSRWQNFARTWVDFQ